MPAADVTTPATYRRRQETLTAGRARELLSYDPHSGALCWRVSRQGVRGAGSPAGTRRRDGYMTVFVAGRAYLAHRLIWLIHHGHWPENRLDHVDGNRARNVISNLRLATAAQNAINRRSGRPASGYRGVTKRGERYSARISVNGTTLHLGACSCIEVAVELYARAAALHFGGFAPHDQLEWVG